MSKLCTLSDKFAMKKHPATWLTLGISGLALLAYVVLNACFHDALPLPSAESRITDNAGALSVSETAGLLDAIDAVEQSTGARISILLVPNLRGEPIEKYAERVANLWWPEQNEVDKHILMLISTHEKRAYLKVGHGLQEVIPARMAQDIVAENIMPAIRKNRVDDALTSGIEAVFSHISKEKVEDITSPMYRIFEKPASLTGLFVYLFLVASLLAVIKRLLSWGRKKDDTERSKGRHGPGRIRVSS